MSIIYQDLGSIFQNILHINNLILEEGANILKWICLQDLRIKTFS